MGTKNQNHLYQCRGRKINPPVDSVYTIVYTVYCVFIYLDIPTPMNPVGSAYSIQYTP